VRTLFALIYIRGICIFSSMCCAMQINYCCNAIEQSAAELLQYQCLALWPWTCFKCCARFWDNFHQVWPSTTYPCLNYIVFMLMRNDKLWSWPLTADLESLWYIKRHVIKVCTKFEQNRAIAGWIINNFAIFFAHVMLRRAWPWPLTSWRWLQLKHVNVRWISQGSIKTPFKEDRWFWCHFVTHLLGYLCTNTYSNKERFDKVITKIKWCSFLPHIDAPHFSDVYICCVHAK